MTDKTQPEALRLAKMLTADEWPGSVTLVSYARECVAELRRQHDRIAELEAARFAYASEFEPNGDGDPDVGSIHANIRAMKAKLASIDAGGVQELSAAPEAIAKLRHLYQNMVNGAVRDTASAKRIAEGLLAPAIEALERAAPPAEQQAAPKAAPAEVLGWIYEDELPESYPYSAMFPHSKVDTVRMFPVFGPTAAPGAPYQDSTPAPAPLSEREAFETAWEKLHGKRPVLWSQLFASNKMETPAHSEGRYFAASEQAAWKQWQARAALAAQGGKV